MSMIPLDDAKQDLSDLVDQAGKGEIITITRHGRPVAALVSLETAKTAGIAMAPARKNFGAYLLDFPGGLTFERDTSPLRDVDL